MNKKYNVAKLQSEHVFSLFTQADKAWKKNRNGSNASRFWIQRQKFQRMLIQAKRKEQQAFEAMLKEDSKQALIFLLVLFLSLGIAGANDYQANNIKNEVTSK